MLACLMNFRFNAVPQELAGGNMSPMRKTAGQKAAATRKDNAKAPGGCRESRFNSQAPRRRQEGRSDA
jgi:hypothetical protein